MPYSFTQTVIVNNIKLNIYSEECYTKYLIMNNFTSFETIESVIEYLIKY